MNADISNQLQILLNIDGVNANDAITINSICSQILNNKEYTDELCQILNSVFNEPNFDVISEISQVIILLLKLSAKCTFSISKVSTEQLKYVFYVSLYYYLSSQQPNLFRMIDQGTMRLAFDGAFALIKIPVEVVQIVEKTCCVSCSGFFSKSKKIHI